MASFEEVRRAVREQSGSGGMLVLDVRKPREREEPGRIPGTKNVPCKRLHLHWKSNVMYVQCRFACYILVQS